MLRPEGLAVGQLHLILQLQAVALSGEQQKVVLKRGEGRVGVGEGGQLAVHLISQQGECLVGVLTDQKGSELWDVHKHYSVLEKTPEAQVGWSNAITRINTTRPGKRCCPWTSASPVTLACSEAKSSPSLGGISTPLLLHPHWGGSSMKDVLQRHTPTQNLLKANHKWTRWL